MTDTITITGLVATEPRRMTTSTGLDIASFRLASTQRRYDQEDQKWVDGETNWYTVSAFRQLAINLFASVEKGNRVIITGTLRIRSWESGDKHGTNVDVEADTIGHDLTWGTSEWTRTSSPVPANETPEQDAGTFSPATEPVQE